METKLDKIADRIDEIRDDIADMKIDLSEHILRTKLAEENIAMLRRELKPVESHVQRVNGGIKALSTILVIAAVVKVFIEFL